VESIAEAPLLAARQREPGDEVVAELFGFDHRVDHQFGRQSDQVAVGRELGASRLDELVALVGVVDRRDLLG
jgi:hypothetical protein